MLPSSSTLTSPIYIYTAEPVITPFCSSQICSRLEDAGISSSRVVKVTDGSYLKRQLLSDKQATLIIPGGYSHLIAAYLEDVVVDVQNAVKGGWNYLGLCAGGNFACMSLTAYQINKNSGIREAFNFAKHQRFLHLLPVDAISDVYPLNGHNILGADNGRIAKVEANSTEFSCYWNEGSKFIPKTTQGLDIVARYADIADKPVAVVSGTYGLGHVTITGIHPEADFSLQRVLSHTFTEDDQYMLDKFGGEYASLAFQKNRQQLLRELFVNAGILPKT